MVVLAQVLVQVLVGLLSKANSSQILVALSKGDMRITWEYVEYLRIRGVGGSCGVVEVWCKRCTPDSLVIRVERVKLKETINDSRRKSKAVRVRGQLAQTRPPTCQLRALLTLQDRPLLGLIHDSAKSLHFAVQDPPVSAFLFLAIAHCAAAEDLICKFQQVRLLPGRPSWFWIEARVVRKLSTW